MAFHVMLLFIWLATAMGYTDSSLVVRAKLCRLLLQSRDEVPCPSLDESLIRVWVDSMLFPVQV